MTTVTLGIPALASMSHADVSFEAPLPFGRGAREDLDLLRLLREATSHAVRLRWRLGGLPCYPLRTYIHLVPPSAGVDPQTTAHAREWRAGYRYGSYFYREGPGFVMVKDVRPGDEPRRLTIAEGSEHFLAMARASAVSDLDAAAAGTLDTAQSAELLVHHDDRLLVLPYRMRHWPVPYVAI
jgi:hypothetical protein